MKINELLAFIITIVIVLLAVLFLVIFLSQKTEGQVLANLDDFPLSAVSNINEAGFYIRGLAGSSVFSLFGKYTFKREHLFAGYVLGEYISYAKYNDVARYIGEESVSRYGGILGYRYQFWDVDSPFLGFAVKAKWFDIFSFDVDATLYETKTKTMFSPSISVGVENVPFLPRLFLVVSQMIKSPINVLVGLKGSLVVAEETRGFQGGFFVSASLKEYRWFSNLALKIENDFSEVGYLRTNVGVVLGFKDVLGPRMDLEIQTKYRSHEYLGDNGDFCVKVLRKKHTPEVESLINELRELEVVVSRIKDFTLGQNLLNEAHALIQQGAYDQARDVMEKLRLYLKEW